MSKFSFLRWQYSHVILFFVGVLLAVFGCGILVNHIRLFSLKRDTAVMIGTTLPELTSSVALLEANVEAEKMFTENALASREELADVYILPSTSPGPRVVDVLTELANAFTSIPNRKIVLERVALQSNPISHDDSKSYGVDLTLRGNFQSISSFLGVLGFSGDMMIKDVLSPTVQSDFLASIESVAPLSLKQAEDFLYLDLLAYAADPESRESRVFKDIPSELVPDVKALLLSGGLADVRIALGTVAPLLHKKNVWPLPLLTIESLTRSGDVWKVKLLVYGR